MLLSEKVKCRGIYSLAFFDNFLIMVIMARLRPSLSRMASGRVHTGTKPIFR